MIEFVFGEHQIVYNERGNYHVYVALVDLGELYDCRIGLALNEDDAKEALEKGGGRVVAVFALVDSFQQLAQAIKRPQPKIPPVLSYKDTLLL